MGSSTHIRLISGVADACQFDERFLGAPGLVGVDHHQRARADGLAQEIEPVQVAVEIGMADLDLECAVAERVGVAEELGEFVVRQVKVETGGIGADAVAPASEQPVKRQPDLLGGKIPHRDLHRLLERQRMGAPVAAARPVDPVDECERRLAFEAGPHLAPEDAIDLLKCRERTMQVLHESEAGPPLLVEQLKRGDAGFVELNLAVADDAIPRELVSGEPERRYAHGDLTHCKSGGGLVGTFRGGAATPPGFHRYGTESAEQDK